MPQSCLMKLRQSALLANYNNVVKAASVCMTMTPSQYAPTRYDFLSGLAGADLVISATRPKLHFSATCMLVGKMMRYRILTPWFAC